MAVQITKEPVTFDELYEKVKSHAFWTPFPDDWNRRKDYLLLAMAAEAGEALNMVKKDQRGDKGAKYRLAEEKMEIIDTLNYALMAAHHMGIDILKEAMAKILEVEERPEYKAALRKHNRNKKLQKKSEPFTYKRRTTSRGPSLIKKPRSRKM